MRDFRGILMMAVCMIALLAGAVKGKAEWLLNVIVRSILGAVAMYFINQGLDQLGIASYVGINPITILTSGILGLPGFLALYAIGFYQVL